MSDKPGLVPWGLLITLIVGIATFLAQKEADMVDGDISAVRDSVVSTAKFKLNYGSDIDDAYLDNILEFKELVDKCAYFEKKSDKIKEYCSHDQADAGDLKVSDLRQAFDLFSEPYIDQQQPNSEHQNLDINKFIESDAFLRHHIGYKILDELLHDGKLMRENVDNIQADWASLGDMASKNKDTLSTYNDSDRIKQLKRKDLEHVSYNICCNVIEMHKVST
jgi:hypothetical protein